MAGDGPCGECRYDFGEGPERLAERCTAFSADVSGLLHATALDVLRWRPAPGTWSALEYAAHVGAALPWYAGRVTTVLGEPGARLTPFDFDQAALDGRYQKRGPGTVATDLRRACAELATLARSVTRDDLARTGTGSDGTPRTVRVLLARAGHELAHHELDIRRLIAAGTER